MSSDPAAVSGFSRHIDDGRTRKVARALDAGTDPDVRYDADAMGLVPAPASYEPEVAELLGEDDVVACFPEHRLVWYPLLTLPAAGVLARYLGAHAVDAHRAAMYRLPGVHGRGWRGRGAAGVGGRLYTGGT